MLVDRREHGVAWYPLAGSMRFLEPLLRVLSGREERRWQRGGPPKLN